MLLGITSVVLLVVGFLVIWSSLRCWRNPREPSPLLVAAYAGCFLVIAGLFGLGFTVALFLAEWGAH